MYVYSIKDLLGPGWGTYFKIIIGDDPIFLIFDWKYNCINTYFYDAPVQLDKKIKLFHFNKTSCTWFCSKGMQPKLYVHCI